MAHKHPPPISFRRAVHLCAMLVLQPVKFGELEQSQSLEDQPNVYSQDGFQREHVFVLRAALWDSLALTILSTAIGLLLGFVAALLFGRSESVIFLLQLLGAVILLWATLALRGYDIGSFSGATLTERVNQWIFRSLFCFGTILFVTSFGWWTWSQ